MRRALGLVGGMAILSAAWAGLQASAEYRVTLEGGGEGTAKLTQTKRADGGKSLRLVASLRRGNATIEVKSESIFDATGSPVRKIQGYGLPGKPVLHETIVTFDAKGAHAVVRDGGGPKVTEVGLAPKLSRANAAETWFVSVRPKPGDVAKAWTFDPDTLEWVLTETTYVGPVTGGHRLKIVRPGKTGEAVVDDTGFPVRIEEGNMKLERKAS